MFGQVEIFLLGLATVVDTVLLLVMLERVNRPLVPLWLTLLALGTWLLHSASFFHALLLDSEAVAINEWDRLCRCLMGLALLLLPSTILHASVRLNHSGFDPRARWSMGYAILYLPLFSSPFFMWRIARDADAKFFDSVAPFVNGYLIWMVLAITISVGLMLRWRNTFGSATRSHVLLQLSGTLVALATLVLIYVYVARGTVGEPWVRVMTSFSPSVAVTLLVWHTLRQRLMPLVVERTLIYGAFLVVVLLMHQLFVRPLTDMLQRKSNVDFMILELVLLIGLVLVWRPLRQRFSEAARSLMSKDSLHIRDKTRQLSLQLSRHALQPADGIRLWLEQATVADIDVEAARVWLSNDSSNARTSTSVGDHALIFAALCQQESPVLDRSSVANRELCQALERVAAMWAFRLNFQSVQGLALLGNRRRNDRLSDEALTALALLMEQFAVTLHNRCVEQQRATAERRMMQQEKLSVLGLIAGSLAHELRNPLSSIRTIAPLLAEDLPNEDRRQRDVSIIISEIDRLTQTTQRLLDYAKPADTTQPFVEPDRVVARLLPILEQLARQYHVQLSADLQSAQLAVAGSDAALSEILFNLIRNAIEAVRGRPTGLVEVQSRSEGQRIQLSVRDNGPGIDSSIRDSLFQPFVTAKIDGTGLGLYVVAERVRELKGDLSCRSSESEGTEFVVEFDVQPINELKRN
ncbi:MAG: HAMP domain-containing histidine kinase [Pirellulaceae bacterium]|nr:HAMP domain-containing histidine kinase [Pirellulaceae bacterium]